MKQIMSRMALVLMVGLAISLFGCENSPEQASEKPIEAVDRAEVVSEEEPKEAPVKLASEVEEEFIYSLWDELGDHPIDKKLQACTDENPGDMGIRTCLKEALASWNEEVAKWSDAIGNQLLRGKAGEAFNESQSAWESYKDKEFLMIETKYEGMSGTMYLKRMKMEKVILVRHRGLELYNYQQALNVER